MDVRVADEPWRIAAELIARRLAAALRLRGTASLALSGGSTAPPMIAALAEIAFAGAGPAWERVTAWQVDERVAPDGSPARNAGQLDPLPCRVRPMPVTAGDLRAAARRYAAALPERFDVVHLGIGDDGHAASWPPGDAAVLASARAVELVPAFNGWPRMTLTPRAVNAARARVVLATGAAKRDVIARWLAGDASLPISAVRRAATTAVLDPAAAQRLRARSARPPS